MSKSDKNVELQGIKHNLNILKTLLNKLDKDIWIKEFWYSMSEHCKNFPKKDQHGHPDKDGSAYWAELIKKYL